jgi:hypothetical protein
MTRSASIRWSALGALAVFLSGCGTAQTSAVPQGAQSAAHRQLAPEGKGCGGTNGVSVSSCPIVLTKKTRGYYVFYVSGPGVETTYLKEYRDQGLCYKKGEEICSIQDTGSPANYWQAAAGPYCGTAKRVTFYAYGAKGFIGIAHLKITNEYCPKR